MRGAGDFYGQLVCFLQAVDFAERVFVFGGSEHLGLGNFFAAADGDEHEDVQCGGVERAGEIVDGLELVGVCFCECEIDLERDALELEVFYSRDGLAETAVCTANFIVQFGCGGVEADGDAGDGSFFYFFGGRRIDERRIGGESGFQILAGGVIGGF